MMNNSYFRVKVHRTMDEATGMPALKFQHPTLAGPGNFGGWFEEKVLGKADDKAEAEKKPPPPPATATASDGSKKNGITMETVEANDGTKGTDCWFVVKDKVYNGTPFLADHPGGGASIMIVGGTDCTEEFGAFHSSKAWNLLDKYYIGELVSDAAAAAPAAPDSPAPAAAPVTNAAPTTLHPKQYVTLPLEKRIELSHDTRLFRFSLPSKEHELGLPIGQHLFIRADIDGKKVMRAYTPLDSGKGYVDFVIKVYFAGVHPRFPEGGKLTQHLDKMQLGETITVRGPMGEFIFNVNVGVPRPLMTFTHTVNDETFGFNTIGFIAGGSGITPVLQTARALLTDTTNPTRIFILYANRTEDDILCGDTLKQIDELDNVDVWYTLDQPPEGWKYSSGFIDEAMCRDHLPTPSDSTYIFCCGPPPMIEYACKPNLAKAGHKADKIHCF
jgi:nitrate reductase (NAD(P)H)